MKRPKRQRNAPARYVGWYRVKMLTASRDKQHLDSVRANVNGADKIQTQEIPAVEDSTVSDSAESRSSVILVIQLPVCIVVNLLSCRVC